MAYMRTIVKAQRSFAGEGWVTYDTCYRRKAAASKSLDWSMIDFTLYNETFAGRTRAVPRCRYCSSDLHASHECTYAPTTGTATHPSPVMPSRTQDPCLLFNNREGNKCTFNPCRYLHVCVECKSPRHALSQCPRAFRQKKRREESPYRKKDGEKRL